MRSSSKAFSLISTKRRSVTLELPGGSGFGDPKERDPEAIRQGSLKRGSLHPKGLERSMSGRIKQSEHLFSWLRHRRHVHGLSYFWTKDSGQTWVHKCLTTPENPAEGAMEGMAALLKERGLCHGRPCHGDPRDHAGDKRSARANGREHRLAHHKGFPGHPSDGQGATLRHLRPVS